MSGGDFRDVFDAKSYSKKRRDNLDRGWRAYRRQYWILSGGSNEDIAVLGLSSLFHCYPGHLSGKIDLDRLQKIDYIRGIREIKEDQLGKISLCLENRSGWTLHGRIAVVCSTFEQVFFPGASDVESIPVTHIDIRSVKVSEVADIGAFCLNFSLCNNTAFCSRVQSPPLLDRLIEEISCHHRVVLHRGARRGHRCTLAGHRARQGLRTLRRRFG